MRISFSIVLSLAVLCGSFAPASAASKIPPGGKYKNCHGYILHVSLENVRVHCTDGIPANLSFLSWPKFVKFPDGTTVQSKDLKPYTRVHVIFTQSLGIRHAYKVFVYGSHGRALYYTKN